MNRNPVEAPQERKYDIVNSFALIKEYTNLKCTKWTTLKSLTLLFVFCINYATFLSKAYIRVVYVTLCIILFKRCLLMNISAKGQRLFCDSDLLKHALIHFRRRMTFLPM